MTKIATVVYKVCIQIVVNDEATNKEILERAQEEFNDRQEEQLLLVDGVLAVSEVIV
jgi:hypothetical protein